MDFPRPNLINFTSIRTQSKFSVRASLNYISDPKKSDELETKRLTSPLESISLLNSHQFKIKLVGLNSDHKRVFRKIYESDSYGNFEFKIPIQENSDSARIKTFQIYDVGSLDGVELLLGTRIPIVLNYPKKIIISDFDKTLVDTRYSTAREVYESLKNPIDHFPLIPESIELLKNFMAQDFQPFILTASPHFYENAIRDWLYQQGVYTAEIFLKDYRKILSVIDGLLTAKDLKSQGFYKLNHLVTILNMTGIPEELVLVGDGFESDPLIYLTLATLLENQTEPWNLWNQIKKLKAFKLTRKQDSLFLNKVYQLQNEIQRKNIKTNTQIYIRTPKTIDPKNINVAIFENKRNLIEYYRTN